jgi:uncharacterized sulfatase
MTQQSVVWITIESLRADATSLGDPGLGTTPNLEAKAAEGHSFESCHAHATWTRPSTASILTGLPPAAHRVWTNDAALHPSIHTIPEAFHAMGYHTVGVSPIAQFSAATGLDRGFDDFHFIDRRSVAGVVRWRTLLGYLARIWSHSGGLTWDGRQFCTSYLVNALGERHIRGSTDRPLFLYLHYGDTHLPYVPPKRWRDSIELPAGWSIDEAVRVALQMSEQLYELNAGTVSFDAEAWAVVRSMYHGSIRYVDHMVGELMRFATEQLEDPIIVVTADHGEAFGEAGHIGHGQSMHSAVTNVPLVIQNLAEIPTDGLIQHADVMRALCERLGVPHPVPVGCALIDAPRRYAVTQEAGETRSIFEQKLRTIRGDYERPGDHSGDLTSMRTAEWRYDRSDTSERLFALPDEEHNVIADHPIEASKAADAMDDWSAEMGKMRAEVGRAAFTPAMREQLTELGYL